MKRKVLLIAVLHIFSLSFAQTELFYPDYKSGKLKNGSYQNKSYAEEYFKLKLPIIKSNLVSITPQNKHFFLNPNNKEIVLFENHDLDNLKPIGKLTSLTQVNLDSIIYKYKFKDFTNCVWNRIIINDQYYYTDADIHDFSITKELNKLNQKVYIIAQNDGYDGHYHLGYPEYFFLIFTNNQNHIINKTDILKFYLNNEYAMEEDILNIEWNQSKNTYEINLLGADEKIKVSWDGKVFEFQK